MMNNYIPHVVTLIGLTLAVSVAGADVRQSFDVSRVNESGGSCPE
jgi:hypothetical protein